jgi:methionyl-tRNA formyltransferase
MYIDAGIDTGEIIHQMRARIFSYDNPHQIGNRLIADMVPVLASLVEKFNELPGMTPLSNAQGREYRMRDFTADSVEHLYNQFSGGLIQKYLSEKDDRHARCPIIENPMVLA